MSAAKWKHTDSQRCRVIAAALLVITLAIKGARAEEPSSQPEWHFYLTPYLWIAGTSGTAETPDPRLPSQNTQASFGHVLSHLNAIPFMGAAEARYGRFGLALDLMVLSVKSDFATRDVVFHGGSAEMTQVMATVLGTYRAVDTRSQWLDIGLGVRPWHVSTKLSFNPGLLPGFSNSATVSWADPIVALRYHLDFTDRFGFTAYGDVGGFGAGSELTWQLLGTLDYRLTDWAVLHAGYRHLYIDYKTGKTGGLEMKTAVSGPTLAATFRF